MRHEKKVRTTFTKIWYTCDIDEKHTILDGDKTVKCGVCGLEICHQCLSVTGLIGLGPWNLCPHCKDASALYMGYYRELHKTFMHDLTKLCAAWANRTPFRSNRSKLTRRRKPQ